jgi:hypothetical protein
MLNPSGDVIGTSRSVSSLRTFKTVLNSVGALSRMRFCAVIWNTRVLKMMAVVSDPLQHL